LSAQIEKGYLHAERGGPRFGCTALSGWMLSRLMKKDVAVGLPRQGRLKSWEIWRGKPAATSPGGLTIPMPGTTP